MAKRTHNAAHGQRLSPEVRRQQILDAAIDYFAEAGFAVQTRELTRRIGVSQPLLYRYFPSKQALIEAVFEAVFIDRWDERSLDMLRDRKLPLRERLIRFYGAYLEATYTPQWLRIYFFAGLAGFEFNRDYVRDIVEKKILRRLCEELRAQFVPPAMRRRHPQVTAREIELAWMLQSSLFYSVVRQSVLHSAPRVSRPVRLADAVDLFLAGAGVSMPQVIAAGGTQRPSPARRSSTA